LNLMDSVPDSTTLIKLNQRFGEERIRELNKQLVKHLVKTKAIKPRKIRIDSTTLEANIIYPTDNGLLHQTVRTLTRTAKNLGEKITSHVRATKKAVARFGASLKNIQKNERRREALKNLKKLARLAQHTVAESQEVLQRLNKRSSTKSSQRMARLKDAFTTQVALAERILQQTEQKLAGVPSIEERIVSFFDPEARVIRKGKLHKPNEFGRTLQLTQDVSGVIMDYDIHEGNPADKSELLPMVERFIDEFGENLRDIAADKGYYSAENLAQLRRLGIRRIGIPKLGRLTPREKQHQHKRWFKALYRFRAGIEAGISMLKRVFSLGRVLARGSSGTRVWTGWSILSYNLWQQT